MTIKVTYNIKTIRQSKQMTIDELSKLSGVSGSQINDIENNKKDATIKTLCMIAIALRQAPSDLFQYETK